jgi:hypothetical protein
MHRREAPTVAPTKTRNEEAAPRKTESLPEASRKEDASKGAWGSGPRQCSICTEDFIENEKVRILPCRHLYHRRCIDPWLLNFAGTCPLWQVGPHELVNNRALILMCSGIIVGQLWRTLSHHLQLRPQLRLRDHPILLYYMPEGPRYRCSPLIQRCLTTCGDGILEQRERSVRLPYQVFFDQRLLILAIVLCANTKEHRIYRCNLYFYRIS